MKTDCYDLLIVGQGLAGLNLSFSAKKDGVTTFHVHHQFPGESTKVAAGLINPITGRRFVKSWMIEEVMPFAEVRYKELGNLLGGKYIERLDILRTLSGAEDENNWLAKSADPYLAQFLQEDYDVGAFAQKIVLSEFLAELQNCFRIKLEELQKNYLSFLEAQNEILYEAFDYSDLNISKDTITYKGITAKHVVFSEGWKTIDNPFFKEDGFSPAKGELLIVKIPNLGSKKAFKKDIFITPLGDELYWVGATYEWGNFDPTPTDKMRSKLLKSLDAMLKIPYEIITHKAGIRPSSRDRRPVLGTHRSYKNMHIFNGMGTKGSSLAPYYSSMLIEHIFQDKEIQKEVSIERYRKP